jgi:phage terminase small subunit
MPKVIRDAMGLSERERRFVECYCRTWDRAQAVEAAGYNSKNRAEIGWQLLQKPHVKHAVHVFTAQSLAELGVDLQRINIETARIAFFDPRAILNEYGVVRPPWEWDEESAAAVARMEVKTIWIGRGKNRLDVGHHFKVQFHDKMKALVRLLAQLDPQLGKDEKERPLIEFNLNIPRPTEQQIAEGAKRTYPSPSAVPVTPLMPRSGEGSRRER